MPAMARLAVDGRRRSAFLGVGELRVECVLPADIGVAARAIDGGHLLSVRRRLGSNPRGSRRTRRPAAPWTEREALLPDEGDRPFADFKLESLWQAMQSSMLGVWGPRRRRSASLPREKGSQESDFRCAVRLVRHL